MSVVMIYGSGVVAVACTLIDAEFRKEYWDWAANRAAIKGVKLPPKWVVYTALCLMWPIPAAKIFARIVYELLTR